MAHRCQRCFKSLITMDKQSSAEVQIRYVHFPEIECPPLSMTPITHAVQTPQQHVEKPIVTHKTQSITIGNNRHKGTNNSVADAIKRVSPLSQRPTEDVTPLHVLSDSIPVHQSCLDSVQTEAKKDGTLHNHGTVKQPSQPDAASHKVYRSMECQQDSGSA